MKLICFKKDLKEAVSICDKISGKNLNLPILSNILLDANGKDFKLISTNLELGVEIIIPAKIENKGKIIIPASIFNSFLSNISENNQINLEVQNNNLIISTNNNSTFIKSQPFDDFPNLPKLKSDNKFSIPIIDFISGLKTVFYACSLSIIKPEISSVYLYSNKTNMLTFAATDSFRLAEKKLNYFFPELGQILIPFKTVVEIIRIFEGKEGRIDVLFNKNQINIIKENIIFISRLTDGVFPDYNQIIPKKFTTDVVINKDFFINSLKISGVFSGKLNELNVAVNPEDSFFVIKTSNNELGENISKIPAKITGESVKITFNYKYIYDCLSNINSEEIILRFSGEGKPLLITGAQDNTFQYLVMPMSV
ncbi:MAG: DNA polymerase III subunit beta [Candidatus Terrybacteria bacterium RIFCSPLOWO2_02_42_20]|uniref:Beta sliding clamp n=1 Tax=Candidatus Terrybacteria bacterium RIFCSPLOWO2_02_42_20 TaxID=1802370 RepID=A0A1G2PZX9_9BACT|nr:MAG: DNA polymerase III subunit beta [Candidatus Terrybacteria bacterium RIFCSPLOWO2_02_42_20]